MVLLTMILQLHLLIRVVVASVCGAAIGYERQNRLKVAGVRTHLIVALGSALMMEISKYGFADVLGMQGVALDPSRIAAQIVSGIGFLGAGIIFVRKQEISGLTTAAGIWSTAGIGMAIGAGLYCLGIASAALIILVQIILHKDIRWLHEAVSEHILLELDDEKALEAVREEFGKRHISIISVKIKKAEKNSLSADLCVKLPDNDEASSLMHYFCSNRQIKSVHIG